MMSGITIPAPAELAAPEVGVAGLGYRLLISSQQSGGVYELMYFVVPPGLGCPLHVHHFEDECAYTIEGEIEGIVGDQVVRTPAGTAQHLPRLVPHGFRNVGTTTARILMWVTPGRLQSFYDACATPWDCNRPTVAAPTELEIAGMANLAAQYGIEILPA